MAENINITKLGIKNKTSSNKISLDDWIALVEADPELEWFENTDRPGKEKLPLKRIALWDDPDDPSNGLFFEYTNGKFTFGFGNDVASLKKLLDVSRKLNATLQDDGGFDIDERYINGEIGIPYDDEYHQEDLVEPNLSKIIEKQKSISLENERFLAQYSKQDRGFKISPNFIKILIQILLLIILIFILYKYTFNQ